MPSTTPKRVHAICTGDSLGFQQVTIQQAELYKYDVSQITIDQPNFAHDVGVQPIHVH